MQINHIVTSRQGGAFISAKSLHLGLIEKGIDSRIYLRNSPEMEDSVAGENPIRITFGSRSTSRALTAFQAKFVQRGKELITTFGTKTSYSWGKMPANSILHIHSIYNFVNSAVLENWVSQGRTLVFQLHDQRFLTGGCHHDLGCKGFESQCANCPQVNGIFRNYVTKEKKRINSILSQKNVHIIAPSQFLLKKASKLIPRNRLHLIPNLPDKIHPITGLERSKFRNQVKLSQADFVLGFCAANIDSPYKNFAYFKEIVKELKKIWTINLPNLKVVLVGEGGMEFRHEDLIRFRSNNNNEVRTHIAAMDLLLVPSKVDNVPNVIVEALLEGTPVLASRVGGIPDLLDHLEGDVFLTGVPLIDAIKIVQMVKSSNRELIKSRSREKFDRNRIMKSYLDFYDSL